MPRAKTKKVATNTQPEEVLAPVEETEEVEDVKEEPKKDTPLPINVAKVPFTGKALAMKKKLEAQPKVPTFIPLVAGEKVGVTQPVILNGYPMYIPKGVNIEVPVSVKEVLDIKLKQQNAVTNHPYNITGGNKQTPLTQYGG